MSTEKRINTVTIPIEILEMVFDTLDQEDIGYILEAAIGSECYDILLDIAMKAGKVQP